LTKEKDQHLDDLGALKGDRARSMVKSSETLENCTPSMCLSGVVGVVGVVGEKPQ
jgi:hypothetical protein